MKYKGISNLHADCNQRIADQVKRAELAEKQRDDFKTALGEIANINSWMDDSNPEYYKALSIAQQVLDKYKENK